MEKISYKEAVEEFNSGGEVWVHTGDYGTMPMFEYELDEDGNEIIDDDYRLMHPKSEYNCDTIEDLEGYNNYYIPE